MSRERLPLGALALVGLLAADVTGLVDLSDVSRVGGQAAVGAVRGYSAVLASALPAPPEFTPRRKKRRKPRASTSRPPAAAASSGTAREGIPRHYLRLYREAGASESWPDSQGRRYAAWAVLAGIGLIESGHGTSNAPGVRDGVNAFGCCAGPMQFNLRNGPPSTWDTYGRGGNPYDPADAIPAAVRLLKANGAQRNLDRALYSYNHSASYVAGVKAQARRYQGA